MHSYHVTVVTAHSSCSYITQASTGVAAVSHALGQFPQARKVSAKPVATRILG